MIPALFALLVVRYLVPPVGAGFLGVIAALGHRYTLAFGTSLFLFASALARYWRFHVPGGRYSARLPLCVAPQERDPYRLAEWAKFATLYDSARNRRNDRIERHRAVEALRAALIAGNLVDARAAAHAIAGATPSKPLTREALWTFAGITVAAGAALVLRATLFQPYTVLSASMLPTLEPGDTIAGNKLAYCGVLGCSASRMPALPHRGDAIVFGSAGVPIDRPIALPDVLVKRVIGLPGDRITMVKGLPVINGWAVPSCEAGEYVYIVAADGTMIHARLRVEFLGDSAYLTALARSVPFDGAYVVQRGEVFVLGDNRSNSQDSRAWNHGRGAGVPLLDVAARADWFLTGTHRSGESDWTRFLRPLDAVQRHIRMEAMDERAAQSAIAHCLATRPKETVPPPPGDAPVISAAGSALP